VALPLRYWGWETKLTSEAHLAGEELQDLGVGEGERGAADGQFRFLATCLHADIVIWHTMHVKMSILDKFVRFFLFSVAIL
jgi:hypothetical protein